MTKRLRKRLYGPEIWIADNTVPSSKEKVYRLSQNESTMEDELPLEAVKLHLFVEDIVSTYMKI